MDIVSTPQAKPFKIILTQCRIFLLVIVIT